MIAILGITSAILAMAAACNSDFIAAVVFAIGGALFAYEMASDRSTFQGGPM